MKLAKSLVVQLTPLGVSNEDIQRFKFPTLNYWIMNKKIKNNKNKNWTKSVTNIYIKIHFRWITSTREIQKTYCVRSIKIHGMLMLERAAPSFN